jgi:hypothetical protein
MRRRPSAFLVSTLAALAGGCMQGTVATRTGPAGPTSWSTDKHQAAHVGEPVEFEFLVVRVGTSRGIANAADYAVWEFGPEYQVTRVDAEGRFHCTHAFTQVPPAGADDVLVRVTAYRQRRRQDAIVIGDELVHAADPYDLPDAVVASDKLHLRVYQAQVRFDVPPASPPLVWETAMLTFERDSAAAAVVRPQRLGRPGFAVIRAEGEPNTVIAYEPTADQVNPTGWTRVTLLVRDEDGQEHLFKQTIPTP